MRRWERLVASVVPALVLAACGNSSDSNGSTGFEAGSLGAPCLGEDELLGQFSGFALTETVIYELSTDCDSQVCIVNHFEGRASCPYGQAEQEALTDPQCFVPDSDEPVTVPVPPQLLARPAATSMTCSCRCAGPGDGPFCACPNGLVCEPVVLVIGAEPPADAPSYCIPSGMAYDPRQPPDPDTCDRTAMNCGDSRPY